MLAYTSVVIWSGCSSAKGTCGEEELGPSQPRDAWQRGSVLVVVTIVCAVHDVVRGRQPAAVEVSEEAGHHTTVPGVLGQHDTLEHPSQVDADGQSAVDAVE
jgi:hypothetical protein